MTTRINNALRYEFLIPVKVAQLSAEDTAEVFVQVANKHIKYTGQNGECIDTYMRIDRNDDGTVNYFHYWLYHEGKMFKAGSGGYIPKLHPQREQILEFELKHFDPKGQYKLKNDEEEN